MDIDASCLDPSTRARVGDVLREVHSVVGDSAGATWEDEIALAQVRGLLSGGRSGAIVVDVHIVDTAHRPARLIVKIASIASIAREWSSYRNSLASPRRTLIPPVEAVSLDVLDYSDSVEGESDRDAAIVYQHIADYTSVNDEPTETLESLVRDALEDESLTSRVVGVLSGLSGQLTQGLWQPKPTISRSLVDLNPELGPDLVVEVDRLGDRGEVTFGSWRVEQRRRMKRTTDDVLRASCGARGAEQEIAAGTYVALGSLTPQRLDDGRLIARRGPVSVEIRVAEGAEPGFVLDGAAGLPAVSVVGRVVEVRADRWRTLIRRAVPELALTGNDLLLESVAVQDPIGHVLNVLETQVDGRLVGLTHGDLNPRNVLRLGGQNLLIDFERVGKRPPLSDAAWLEVCLLRDIVFPVVGWSGTVRLQRLLGVASHLVDGIVDDSATRLPASIADTEPPEVRSAFAVLWALRRGARRCHRDAGGSPEWHLEYHTHLVLAAMRTLKWIDDDSAAGIPASLATAGVAVEWLTESEAAWPSGAMTRDGVALVDQLDPATPHALDRLGDLRDALRRDGVSTAEWRPSFERARDAVVRRAYVEVARSVQSELEQDHDLFITLQAFIDLRGALRPHPRWPGYNPDPLIEMRKRWSLAGADDEPLSPSVEPDESDDEGWGDGKLDEKDPDDRDPHHPASDEVDDTADVDLVDGFGHPDDRFSAAGGTSGDALTLITRRRRVVVLGEAGSGKSTVARELQYRHAKAIVQAPAPSADAARNGTTPRAVVPITLRAATIRQALTRLADPSPLDVIHHAVADTALASIPAAVLRTGAANLTVDAVNEISPADRRLVATWITAFAKAYPQVGIVVCQRLNGYDPRDFPRYPTVSLADVDDDQASDYIRRAMRVANAPNHEARAATLIGYLLEDQQNATVREFARTPLFLWMLVDQFATEHTLPTGVGDLFKRFTDRYLTDEHHHRESAARPSPVDGEEPVFTPDEMTTGLRAIARWRVERGNTTDIPWEDAAREIGRHGEDAARMLRQLIGTDILLSEELDEETTVLRFRHQSLQEYFAAEALSAEAISGDALRGRALQFSWREPLQIMLSFSGGNPELAERLVDLVVRPDPRYAATLLLWSENAPRAAANRFLNVLDAVLRSEAGAVDWGAAADALARYGVTAAIAVLHDVAVDQICPTTARSLAYEAIATAMVKKKTRETGVARQRLLDSTGTLLDRRCPIELRILATRTVGTSKLTELVAYLTALVTLDEPWPIVSAAWNSLQQLDQVPAPQQRALYVAACERRLDACERELHGTSGSDDVDRLQDERFDLLSELTEAGRIDLVLPRRFSYGICDWPWQWWWSRLDLGSPLSPDVNDTVRNALAVVKAVANTDELIDLVATSTDSYVITAGAHEIANVGPDTNRLINRITVESPHELILAAAQLVDFSDEDAHRQGVALVRSLIRLDDPSRSETLAALLASFPDGPETAALFIDAISTASPATFTRMATWPFANAYFTSSSSWDEYIDDDLADTPEGRTLLAYMIVHGQYSNDLVEPAQLDLSADAVARFASQGPAEGWASLRHLLACALLGITSVLPNLQRLAVGDPVAHELRPTSHRLYGTETRSRASTVLIAVGYAGRLAHDRGETSRREEAHRFLTDYDSSGMHPTVERGRLYGLAVLGAWEPLLANLDPGDTRMHAGAKNAITLWRKDGPYVPAWGHGDEGVAQWIAERLANPEIVLAPQVRSTLAEIRHDLEQSLGRLVVPD